MKTLAIETSCDDTSISIVSLENNNFVVKKLISYSQIKEHNKYWWVVPEIASRLHQEKIIQVLEKIWFDEIKNVDNISVTSHPWLPWSLLVWITTANFLSSYFNKPLKKINHIYWHIFSLFLERNVDDFKFPILVLTASWWHNNLYFIEKNWSEIKLSNFNIKQLWKTLDDASWESFDKVSRLLSWPYPWWPRISKIAKKYIENKSDYSSLLNKLNESFPNIWKWTFFKRIKIEGYDFSFSWMKSQVYNLLKKLEHKNIEITDKIREIIAYEFQECAIDILIEKIKKWTNNLNIKTIWISWWVSANDRLFEKIQLEIQNVKIIRPIKKIYSTDNWAMIWAVWII